MPCGAGEDLYSVRRVQLSFAKVAKKSYNQRIRGYFCSNIPVTLLYLYLLFHVDEFLFTVIELVLQESHLL